MSWVDEIFSLVWDIAIWFETIAYEAEEIAVVGPALKELFLYVSSWFRKLLTPIAHFSDWVYNANQLLANILSIDTIWTTFRQWFEWAEWSWTWILDAWWYVNGWIDDWWGPTSLIIQGWIAIATQGFNDLVVAWDSFWTITWPEWTGKIDNLTSDVHSFFTLTLPELVSFTWLTSWWNDRLLDVQSLITTAFVDRDSWWSGWIDVKNEVIEFISSPLDWLEGKLADWFLGPEV